MKQRVNEIVKKLNKVNKKKLILAIILFVSILLVYNLPKLLNKNTNLDSVKLKNLNSKAISMMIPDDENDGKYKEYTGASFPSGYLLNINKSYCIDQDGKEVKNVLSRVGKELKVRTKKEVYCTLYFEHSEATILIYDNKIKNMTNCTTVQCALDELYTVRY